MDVIQSFDFSVVNGIQETLKCSFFDVLMPFISEISAVIWPIFGIILLFFKKYRFNGIKIIAAFTFAVLITEFLIKPIFMRERPYMLNPEHILLIAEPFGSSFPSGHTSTSFAEAVQFFGIDKKAGVCALIFAALVGFSRMYLYVHFFTDVLAGLIAGTLISILVTIISEKIRRKISERRKKA